MSGVARSLGLVVSRCSASRLRDRETAQPRHGTSDALIFGMTALQIVYEHPHQFRANGRNYDVHILGCARDDGTWAGWIEFVAEDGADRLRTGQETSQPNRDALAYWASGLEDVYFEGALARAAA